MKDTQYIITKYSDIITEELNIKEVGVLQNIKVQKIYKPIGSQISAKFGKDTWAIIQNGKQWNVQSMIDWSLKVFDKDGNEWILEKSDYEVGYEGLDNDDMIAETDIIVKMDRTITPELEREWIAREMSRFLNQMRKEADLALDEKITVHYYTDDKSFADVVTEFTNFLKDEALIQNLENNKNNNWRHTNSYTDEDKNITFTIV